MSLAHFDEMYEICCGMMEEEEVLIKAKPTMERLNLMNDCIPDHNRWWEVTVREIINEKESELFYV